MSEQPMSTPAPAGAPREEIVGLHVPPTRGEREAIARQIEAFVDRGGIVPPLSFAELSLHTQSFLQTAGVDRKYLPYAAVLLSNEAWKDLLAAVPYDHRLLLLPQCLRSRASCRATIDEYGLVCARCGSCLIDSFQEVGRKLGYTVLVAEGTPIIVELVRSGRIQGIVGVSCLSALERVFPLMEAAAVPAVAIPLLRDGCDSTAVDAEWVLSALNRLDTNGGFLDMQAVQKRVEQWFTAPGLEEVLGPSDGATDQVSRGWLLEAGKRWRPLLTACAYAAMNGGHSADLPVDVHRLAVAVECFHKASLVHDDIEDGDSLRYGRQTLHERWGVPIALNAGDFLLGEGYRLIGQCSQEGEVRARLLQAAAKAHRELCLGQGSELCWLRDFRPLPVAEVLDIFRRKTAPAFAGALRFGAICAGAGEDLLGTLDTYSEHLGVAYQIQDDLDDFATESPQPPPARGGPRPSIVIALAYQAARGNSRDSLLDLWRSGSPGPDQTRELIRLVAETGARQAAEDMLRLHLDKAMASLVAVRIASLKRLLRQVLGGIFPRELLCDPGVFPKVPASAAASRAAPAR